MSVLQTRARGAPAARRDARELPSCHNGARTSGPSPETVLRMRGAEKPLFLGCDGGRRGYDTHCAGDPAAATTASRRPRPAKARPRRTRERACAVSRRPRRAAGRAVRLEHRWCTLVSDRVVDERRHCRAAACVEAADQRARRATFAACGGAYTLERSAPQASCVLGEYSRHPYVYVGEVWAVFKSYDSQLDQELRLGRPSLWGALRGSLSGAL